MFFFYSQRQLAFSLAMVGRWYDFVSFGVDSVPRLRGPYRHLWCRLESGEVCEYTTCSPTPDHGCKWDDLVFLGIGEMAGVGDVAPTSRSVRPGGDHESR